MKLTGKKLKKYDADIDNVTDELKKSLLELEKKYNVIFYNVTVIKDKNGTWVTYTNSN